MLYEQLTTRQDVAGAAYDDARASQQHDSKGHQPEQQLLQQALGQLPLTGSPRKTDDDGLSPTYDVSKRQFQASLKWLRNIQISAARGLAPTSSDENFLGCKVDGELQLKFSDTAASSECDDVRRQSEVMVARAIAGRKSESSATQQPDHQSLDPVNVARLV